MSVGNYFIIALITYYAIFFINIMMYGRSGIVNKNIKINKLRKIPIKSLEQQKAFLNLKYPKKKKTKKTFSDYMMFFVMIVISAAIYIDLIIFFKWLKLDVNFGLAFAIMILLPIIISMILSTLHLDDNNALIDFFRK